MFSDVEKYQVEKLIRILFNFVLLVAGLIVVGIIGTVTIGSVLFSMWLIGII